MNERKKLQILKLVESITRLDGPQLAMFGDLAAERNIADKISFVCQVSMQERDLKEMRDESN